VTSTKPLITSGMLIRGLKVDFEQGRAVSIGADVGGETLRAISERDAGAARLGEVALVDREGRIGPLGTVFYDTLLDENAASHIALGQGLDFGIDDEQDRRRVNCSAIHVDFMIGGDEVAVTGIDRNGREIPLLRGGCGRSDPHRPGLTGTDQASAGERAVCVPPCGAGGPPEPASGR
jgi:aminopeptidase